MKTATFWIATLLILGVTNGMIARKETAIRNGTTMYVELGPRDPRSLMQGDYMALRYQLTGIPNLDTADRRGKFIVRLDDDKVVHFLRLYDGEELAAGESLLRYTRGNSGIRIGADSFFFQEGHAQHYANARYGELKVAKTGESILVSLRNANLSRMHHATILKLKRMKL